MKKPKRLKRKLSKKTQRKASKKTRYPSNLSKGQWRRIRHLFSEPHRIGRPIKWYPRDV